MIKTSKRQKAVYLSLDQVLDKVMPFIQKDDFFKTVIEKTYFSLMNVCTRCGYCWPKTGAEPKVCTKCSNPNWNKPPKSEKK